MFGYVIANGEKLSKPEKIRYRACYCGLCRTLKIRHGSLTRITLSYDMAFLVLLLSALDDAPEETGRECCAVHPAKPHGWWTNGYTAYAADMTVALVYFKALDDWKDEKKPAALLQARMFKGEYGKVKAAYPRQCGVIERCLTELSVIERANVTNPDVPGNCFGTLMGELFVYRDDLFAEELRAFGRSLGKFIYMMDACVDLKEDIRKMRYNPLTTYPSGDIESSLDILMAGCAEKYKVLPVRRDGGLLENILYSGVWTRYEASKRKQKEEQPQ